MIATNFQKIVDVLIDGIISFTDYFIVGKHVTLSEGTLFVLSAGRAIWFTIFGVNIGGSQMLTHDVWIPLFWTVSIAHVVSFFISLKMRIVVMMSYACLWCFLGILMLMANPSAPHVLNFFTFSVLSVFIAVRLMSDVQTDAAGDADVDAGA